MLICSAGSKSSLQNLKKIIFCFFLLFNIVIANAKVIYVTPTGSGSKNGTSWNDAYDNLQTAINDANAGDTIWVKKGNYYPTVVVAGSTTSYSQFFGLNKNIKIFGGFNGDETTIDQRDWINNKTILNGDLGKNTDETSNYISPIGATDDTKRIFVATGNLVSAEVDGFYMKNTYALNLTTISYNSVNLNSELNGILIQSCTGLTLRNIHISRMYSRGMAGLNILNSTVTLDNIYIQEAYSYLHNNNLQGSKITASNIFISNVTAKDNAAGMHFNSDKKSTFENVKIFNATSARTFGTIDILNSDTIRFNRLQLFNNNSGSVAPLNIETSKVIISNALIYNNSNSGYSSVAYCISTSAVKSYLKLVNATITKNKNTSSSTRPVLYFDSYTIVDVHSSLIYEKEKTIANRSIRQNYNNYFHTSITSTNSANNIISALDPFIDIDNNNFQLGIGSTARNAGDSTYLISTLRVANLVNQFDALGNPRVNQAGKLDIGAIEDTLIDALLNQYKYQFQLNEKLQTITTKVENHPYTKLIIQSGTDVQNKSILQEYNVKSQNVFEHTLKVNLKVNQYFELWGVDEYGKQTLLSIKKIQNQNNIQVSVTPNPAIDYLNINISKGKAQSIQIYDIHGRLINSITLKTNQQRVDISYLKSGTYILIIQSDIDRQSIPFIKQ